MSLNPSFNVPSHLFTEPTEGDEDTFRRFQIQASEGRGFLKNGENPLEMRKPTKSNTYIVSTRPNHPTTLYSEDTIKREQKRVETIIKKEGGAWGLGF